MRYGITVLVLLLWTGEALAANKTVKASGGGDYTTIQACATAMANGDTCTVFAGTYNEHVTVTAGGVASYNTLTVNPGDTVNVLDFTINSHTKIDGFKITNPSSPNSSDCVTLASNATDFYITNNTITACGVIAAIFEPYSGNANENHGFIQGNTISYPCSTSSAPNVCRAMSINGDYHLIENNDISHVSGNFVLGKHNVFRKNTIHDLNLNDCGSNSGNCHLDILQADANVVGGSAPAQYLLMEGNTITNSVGVNNKGGPLLQAQSCSGQCFNAIIRFDVASHIAGAGLTDDNSLVTPPPQAWINVKSYNNSWIDVNSDPAAQPFRATNVFSNGSTGGAEINDLFYYPESLTDFNPYNTDASTVASFVAKNNLAWCTGTPCNIHGKVYGSGAFTDDPGNIKANPLFASYASNNFALSAGSPALAAGTNLTSAVGAGASSTDLIVADAGFFQDGSGIPGVQADCIRIAALTTICITAINYATNHVTLASPVSWSNSDPIYLFTNSKGEGVLSGALPNIGAVFGQNITGSSATGSFTIGTTTCGSSTFGLGPGIAASCGKSADENSYCTSAEVASFGTDGPATGPLTCNYTARSASPSPRGVKWTVNTASDLTSALNGAVCGDIIELTAGITVSGNFTLPTKSCAADNWITIRTSGIGSFPAEGIRVTPCYFGVASLPGRPSFNCLSTTKFGATIQASGSTNKPFTFASGVNYVRILGIEFRPDPANTGVVTPLVITGNGSLDHIVFDQIWGHGNASDETQRFTLLQNSNHISFVNSFFTDFKCISGIGGCSDAQAISGGIGGVGTDGTYKFYNNFLEASTENILFGGGGATTAPFDIEVRQNHFFKPLTWNPADPTYNGGVSGHAFSVKNLFELKNATKVFVEGNILDNTWSGFSQTGAAVLLTPVNQSGNCPLCIVTNTIFRYNLVRDIMQAYQVVNTTTSGGGTAGNSYSLHDNIFDNVAAANTCGASCGPVNSGEGSAYSSQSLIAGSTLLMHDVTFDHETVVYATVNPAGTWPATAFLLDGPTAGALQTNFTLKNSIFTAGNFGIGGAFGGGLGCANGKSMLNVTAWFNACWVAGTWTFTNNAIVGGTHVNWNWPANGGVVFPVTYSVVGFVNYNNGKGGDYRLCTGLNLPISPCLLASPYHNAATDGKDIGADVNYITNLTANVLKP